MGWSGHVVVLCALHLSLAASYLLPGDITPSHYDVRLLYDIDPATNFSSYGVVDITLSALKHTSKIVLHMQEFTIDESKVTLTGVIDPPSIKSINLNDTYNLLTLQLDRTLNRHENYTLTIPFYGNLNQRMNGAYISTYVNKDTQSKEITVGHHKSYTAISNMHLMTSSDDNALEAFWPWSTVSQRFKKQQSNFVWDHFQNSVPMSTYLVAFVVSKFSYVESPLGLSKTPFKIWARSDAIDQTTYAATIGPKVLTHFEEWFNVTFPLPKQDMIAIPDFSSGAMENWGLVTYRERVLLYDKKQSSFSNKETVAGVIAHELAHQWFGNLVTMNWWSDLWLNKGFATFAGSVGVATVEPEWGADLYLYVSVPIDDPKRILEIFDVISYSKGALLIRMMTKFLGDNTFNEAIHNYLVKYSYSNVAQDDLWAEMTAVSQKYGVLMQKVTVKRIMDTWTTQTGYPIVDVERDYGLKSLTVTQKRYLALDSTARTFSSWWIPLQMLCQEEATPCRQVPLQWLADTEGVHSRHQVDHGAGSDEWVLFNADMIAPYRINYDQKNWLLLADTLRSGKLATVPILARVQLLSDAFELAWTNRLNYTIALSLASYLQHEDEYLPLETGLKALAKIENVIKRSPDYGVFQKYVRRLVGDAYHTAGGLATKQIVNGHDINSVKMQVLTSSWACRMKVPGCEEHAVELFHKWMIQDNPDKNNPIPIDLRGTVYCVAMERGSVREWRFALARRQRSNVAAARDVLLKALCCTQEIWILTQYLEWSVTDGSEVRRQDAASVIVGVLRSTVGYYVAKDFVYNRIQDIYVAFNSQGILLGQIIMILLNQFTTQQELDEFMLWQAKNEKYLSEATLAVSQAVEKARVNIDWIARNKLRVVEQLREKSTGGSDPDDMLRSSGASNIFITKINCIIYLLLQFLQNL